MKWHAAVLIQATLVLPGSWALAKESLAGLNPVTGPVSTAPSNGLDAAGPSSADVTLEQGRALFDSGQYLPALDKFMKVLRRDPRNNEAREYLRRVVDQMRHTRGTSPAPASLPVRSDSPAPTPTAAATRPPASRLPSPSQALPAAGQVPAIVLDEEIQQRIRQRELFTLDLRAIPGVKVTAKSKQTQVEIDTQLLFADQTGGLREEGIPILDRVAAWLKTFGGQPIVIHSYPDELDESDTGAALFLHRYAQLYGFFVEEKKVSAARFVNTGLAKTKPKSAKKQPSESEAAVEIADSAASEFSDLDIALTSASPRVIIATMGGGALPSEGSSRVSSPKWLEFSIMPSHLFLNPEEGDWTSLDLAALTRKGVRSWNFKIVPAEPGSGAPLLQMEGKGNLLKRISWDGRDKNGSFVHAGKYACRLSATDADGASLNQEVIIEVKRTAAAPEPVAAKAKPKPAPKAKVTAAATPPAPAAPSPAPAAAAPPLPPAPAARKVPDPDPLPDSQPGPLTQRVATPAAVVTAPKVAEPEVTSDPEPEPEPEAPAQDNSTQAIWKQVINFDVNESDLKPTLKASLERISKTLEVYPLQKVHIVGFASHSEADAAQLARRRADEVRRTLINEYQVDARRVVVSGGKLGSGESMRKVEISITN